MSVVYGMRGELVLMIADAGIVQEQTQRQGGGMTVLYLDQGTYVKSFYTVLYAPSCVKVAILQSVHPRIHHRVAWTNCAPMIISDKWRKQ